MRGVVLVEPWPGTCGPIRSQAALVPLRCSASSSGVVAWKIRVARALSVSTAEMGAGRQGIAPTDRRRQ